VQPKKSRKHRNSRKRSVGRSKRKRSRNRIAKNLRNEHSPVRRLRSLPPNRRVQNQGRHAKSLQETPHSRRNNPRQSSLLLVGQQPSQNIHGPHIRLKIPIPQAKEQSRRRHRSHRKQRKRKHPINHQQLLPRPRHASNRTRNLRLRNQKRRSQTRQPRNASSQITRKTSRPTNKNHQITKINHIDIICILETFAHSRALIYSRLVCTAIIQTKFEQ